MYIKVDYTFSTSLIYLGLKTNEFLVYSFSFILILLQNGMDIVNLPFYIFYWLIVNLDSGYRVINDKLSIGSMRIVDWWAPRVRKCSNLAVFVYDGWLSILW